MTDPAGPADAAPPVPPAAPAIAPGPPAEPLPTVLPTLAAPPGPIAAGARDPLVDALRGAALLAVVAVNVVAMGYPNALGVGAAVDEVPGGWALRLTWLLFLGKGYGLLALLYGFGVGTQAARLAAAGADPGRLLPRRLLALAAFGLVHGVLGWYGDILLSYAAFGFLLLPFLRARPRTLLLSAAGLVLLGAVVFLAIGGLLEALAQLPAAAPGLAKAEEAMRQHLEADTAAALRAYGEGPWGALFLRRLGDLAAGWGGLVAVAPEVLGLFLAGLWAARVDLLASARAPGGDPAVRRRLVVAALALLAVGLPLNALHARLAGAGLAAGMGTAVLALATYSLASPLLACAIAAAALLLRDTWPVRALARLLAPLGRVSLSAYLLQTVVLTSVFYFHGLGLYGRLPFPALLGLAVGLWLAEVVLARLWLARFRLGPAEWLLRRLEYGRSPGSSQLVRPML